MNISSIIEVFRMNEIQPKVRTKIIITLGRAINDSMGMNLTEPLVYELVKQLDPENKILSDSHYLQFLTD